MLRLRGNVTEGGEVSMTVSYVEPSGTPSRPAPGGAYELRVLGGNGATLRSHRFTLSFATGEGPTPIARLVRRIPFPAGARRVELRRPGRRRGGRGHEPHGPHEPPAGGPGASRGRAFDGLLVADR